MPAVVGGGWTRKLFGQQGSGHRFARRAASGAGVAGVGLSQPESAAARRAAGGARTAGQGRAGRWCVGVASAVELSMNEPLRASRTTWMGRKLRRTGEISPRPVATTTEEHGRGAAMSQMAARSWCRCRPTRDARSAGRRRANSRHATHRRCVYPASAGQRGSIRPASVPPRRRSALWPGGRPDAELVDHSGPLGREPRQALNRAPSRLPTPARKMTSHTGRPSIRPRRELTTVNHYPDDECRVTTVDETPVGSVLKRKPLLSIAASGNGRSNDLVRSSGAEHGCLSLLQNDRGRTVRVMLLSAKWSFVPTQ